MELHEFSSILWRERRLMELLAYKLNVKKLVAAAGRPDWSAHAATDVQAVSAELRSVEAERAESAQSIAASLGMHEAPSLAALATAVPAQWGRLLEGHRSALADLLAEIESAGRSCDGSSPTPAAPPRPQKWGADLRRRPQVRSPERTSEPALPWTPSIPATPARPVPAPPPPLTPEPPAPFRSHEPPGTPPPEPATPALPERAAEPEHAIRVLLVCTANRCRSPMAEVMLRERLRSVGGRTVVTSAGTRADEGTPAMPEAIASAHGLAEHTSRSLTVSMVQEADLVLCMTREHVRTIVMLIPEAFERTFTLKELVERATAAGPRRPDETIASWLAWVGRGRQVSDIIGIREVDDIDDPIGLPAQAYRRCAADIDSLLASVVSLAFPPS